MELKNKLLEYKENMETVSLRLAKLSNMLKTVSLGLQQENIEEQVIDCLDCIVYSLDDIRNIINHHVS